jgi:hypothetical protein
MHHTPCTDAPRSTMEYSIDRTRSGPASGTQHGDSLDLLNKPGMPHGRALIWWSYATWATGRPAATRSGAVRWNSAG